MRLLSQSTRATIRTITLLAALTSLLLTLLTPFVGSADAAPGDPGTVSGTITFSDGTEATIVSYYEETNAADVFIPGYLWDESSDGSFHLSCSETLVGTTATTTADQDFFPVGITVTIVDFDNLRVNNGGNRQECSADTFVDLEILKSASVTSVSPGDTFSYEVTITNVAEGGKAIPATDVVLTDSVPSPFEVTAVSNAACSFNGNDVTCTVGTLNPGESFTTTISVSVPGDAACGPTENLAAASSTNAAPEESDPVAVDVADCPGQLELDKIVSDVDDVYPDVTEDDFVPTIGDDDTTWGLHTVAPGTYTIGEHDAEGSTHLADGTFTQTSIICNGEATDQVTVVEGETSNCTITNTAVSAGLTVIKQVDNNWGGDLGPSDFPLTVNGESVVSGDDATFPAGDYTVAEEQQPGYELSDSFCTRDGDTVDEIDGESFDISVGPGETVICTFVNQDIPATITLDKTVVNDDGGTLEQDAFPSFLDDDPLAWDTTLEIPAGDHAASETQQPGYTAGDWGGDCAADGTFTAELATDYVCTITNDDIASVLTIEKVVINDDGGTATANDFAPTHGYQPFDGDTAISAVTMVNGGEQAWGTTEVDAGIHTIGEVMLVDGYVLDSIACDRNGDTFASSTSNNLVIEVGLDDDVTCTVTNNDVPAGLTIIKEVVNDDDGSLGVEDFPLLVTPEGGDTEVVDSGAVNTLPAGTYTIGEEQQDGYTLDSIVCDNGVEAADGEDTVTVTVANGESVICTITNNDPEPVVLGEQFEDEDPKPAAELPKTGLDTGRLALWALLITALGVLFLVITAPAPAPATRVRRGTQ